MLKTHAKYRLGQVVRHKKHPFRGVIFDVDAEFSNTEEWYQAIPEDSRPIKDQPFTTCWRKTTSPSMLLMFQNKIWLRTSRVNRLSTRISPTCSARSKTDSYPLHFHLN